MVLVEDIMKTDGIKRCTLVAGNGGLSNVITYLDCLEVADIEPWIRKGEFIVTTGFSIKNTGIFSGIIQTMHRKEGAGIAVKTRFIGMIPAEVIEEADRLNIPLFEIPEDMRLADITMPIMSILVKTYDREDAGEELLRNLLLDGEQKEFVSVKAELLGWPRAPYSLLVMEPDTLKTASDEELVWTVRKFFGRQTVFFLENKLFCIVPSGTDIKELESKVAAMTEEIKKTFGIEIVTGAACGIESYIDMKSAYGEALDAIAIGRATGQTRLITEISQVRLEQALLHLSRETGFRICYADTVGRLRAYDRTNGSHLLPTLEMLVSCMGARQKTADRLYIHRNTLAQRIGKIEQILNCDLNQADTYLNLALMLRIDRYINQEK